MKAVKISTIIISLLFFINLSLSAEKIRCKKYSGTYNECKLTVTFSQNGKMLVEVEEKNGGGYFSTPGSYTLKDSTINFFYRGLSRTLHIENDRITATPYTFSIDEDYKTLIVLIEDKIFSSSCK
ncbi:MAG TPA: hypothetical protein PKG60_06650 [Spirochaetota bacterium]|jgi:hypothetical protein|nr:hypothetical protein [Spirochaetota bacterium]HPS86613.1 hypothetical protein [Spirochaetota bacterium]